MKSLTLPVAALLVFLLGGCSLSNPTISPERNVRSDFELAEDYLASPNMSPVLFQFATINEVSGEFSGFLVDKYGQIRTYELAEAPLEFTQYRSVSISTSVLHRLWDSSSETRESIALPELARRVKTYHREVRQDLDRRRGNTRAEETISFYAYAIASAHSEESGCGGTSTSNSNDNSIIQLPLYVQGRVNLTNQSAYTEEMVQWLTGLIPTQRSK